MGDLERTEQQVVRVLPWVVVLVLVLLILLSLGLDQPLLRREFAPADLSPTNGVLTARTVMLP